MSHDLTGALLWLIPGLPAFGALFLLVAGRRTDRWGHLLGCATALSAFAVGAVQFSQMLGRPDEGRAVAESLFSWVPVASTVSDSVDTSTTFARNRLTASIT